MQRRTFVQTLGASLGGAFAFSPTAGWSARLNRIGLELYAVRGAMRADPDRTLAAVRAMGYTDVELLWSFDNFGQTTEQVRAALEREGLRAPSAHLAPEAITDAAGWKRNIETAKVLGHEYLIVPSLPPETQTSLDVWRRWADRFNDAGRVAREAGIWLAFHNEPDHMKPIGREIPYDVFVARLDPAVVRLQLDVGNMLMGGGDPMAYLSRLGDRYWSFHIKDVSPARTSDTELGTGIFDARAFLRAVRDLDRKPCYVEQEGPADELASAARNAAYLRALDF